MRKKAAKLSFPNKGNEKRAAPDTDATVTVRVTNLTGHKLPTGFAEGRKMWLAVQAVDAKGTALKVRKKTATKQDFFVDLGGIKANGCIIGEKATVVYKQSPVAEGFGFEPDFTTECDPDPPAGEFHFALLNTIKKDNRIPPKGFNKAAYQADGAYIIPECVGGARDAKGCESDSDCDGGICRELYDNGEHWDDTEYTIKIPPTAKKKVIVTTTLYFQTFSRDYMEFLAQLDKEPTEADGGHARNLPSPGGDGFDHWGAKLFDLWKNENNGQAVVMGEAELKIKLK